MRALVFILCLFSVSAMHDSKKTNVGFFIVPRHKTDDSNTPDVMTLEDDGNWYFSKPSDTKKQIFIVKTPYGNRLCLKSDRSLCLRVEKAVTDSSLSLFRRKLCKRAVKKNNIEIVPSPYKNFYMIRLKRCEIYCLYSHSMNDTQSAHETAPNIAKCNYSNTNNHFYLLNEYDINSYAPEKDKNADSVITDIDEDYSHARAHQYDFDHHIHHGHKAHTKAAFAKGLAVGLHSSSNASSDDLGAAEDLARTLADLHGPEYMHILGSAQSKAHLAPVIPAGYYPLSHPLISRVRGFIYPM
ncbi:hypothetical protein NEMIN01_0833 [Nematocida minor]|uniref:uncharacterized protein n=1 Tax=Nematocida minor TaxID=1912983 RepID=UPI00221F0EEE|nr:uncharacterized protein NEMIN01_0833 [Nematocida minor]KAI5190048.1 hypothetical protein NEMIN01_0833 [Nematocida minor]